METLFQHKHFSQTIKQETTPQNSSVSSTTSNFNSWEIFIDRADYPKGYAIYVFNINQTSDDIKATAKKGHTRLSVRFGEKLDESVNLIAYAQFPRVLKIDQARNVILP